jgi:Fe-S cluster assembly iron-binding protein IscA
MLQCTPAAAATLEAVRQHNDIPEGHGVRLFPAPAPEGEVGLGVDFAAAPEADDVVTEQHGTTLMVAADISEQLDGLLLDVVPDPTADGAGAPQLVLRSPEGA